MAQSWLAGVDYSGMTAGIDSYVTDGNLIWFDNLKLTNRGLQNAKGGVKIRHGRINGDLLIASQQTLGVNLPRTVQTAGAAQSFEQMEALFEITPGVFQLSGCLANTLPDAVGNSRPLMPGTLIADAAGEIAVRPNYDELLPLIW